MKTYNVRGYRPADRGDVVRLWRTCGLTRSWNDPLKDIARTERLGQGLFFVAEDEEGGEGENGALIGAVMGGYDGHRGGAYSLAVHPDFQNAGVGKTLMHTLERALIAMGCAKINLLVRESNAEVAVFYQALGYARQDCAVYGKRLIVDDEESFLT
ncbi:GNAT family acetyltransferase [Varunaivibrio sulfuroxidans]|uniref:Ribosomal protein S18 acetylase RimI-like enzyme n=1 Tax=Varunaivibrio sulfuroxidans TaxID=1773489 RepID=A0A4R3J813_9PROT|nr:GNAT family acetyltransferase [Varunaivibrio sulfuroxidans]TCS61607.1 ribosomal protein S18 acetylase RimI-like enzyme [Varunaivibrio sulfuroxidans]WES29518.1 GNAT family acetyltransferase [Varunaivibrio sulfuroxidans]